MGGGGSSAEPVKMRPFSKSSDGEIAAFTASREGQAFAGSDLLPYLLDDNAAKYASDQDMSKKNNGFLTFGSGVKLPGGQSGNLDELIGTFNAWREKDAAQRQARNKYVELENAMPGRSATVAAGNGAPALAGTVSSQKAALG